VKRKQGSVLKCLGVGEGRPDADRFHSSYLYSINGTRFIIDAGEPAAHLLKRAGVDFRKIAAILITHTHADHFGAIIPLIQAMKHGKRTEPLPIHLPAHAIKPLRALLDASYVFKERLPYKLHFIELKKGAEISLGKNVSAMPYPTTHVEKISRKMAGKHPEIAFKAFAFRIEAGDSTIVHTGDLGELEDLDPLLDRPVDLLVCELAHSTPREAFTFLRDKRVKQIAFVHVAIEYWRYLDKLKTQAAAQLPSIKVTFPRDGDAVLF
jgi:ribonuclease BN (tRNA processing enzyme)